jgi:hypothetical protein
VKCKDIVLQPQAIRSETASGKAGRTGRGKLPARPNPDFTGYPSDAVIHTENARDALRDLASLGDLMRLMAGCPTVPGKLLEWLSGEVLATAGDIALALHQPAAEQEEGAQS